MVTRLKFVIESHRVSVVLLLFFFSFFDKLAHVKHDTAGLFMHLIFVFFFYCSHTCFSNKLTYYADIILFQNIAMYT